MTGNDAHCFKSIFKQIYAVPWLVGEHIENTLEAVTALIQRDNNTPGGLTTLAYVEFDVHVSFDHHASDLDVQIRSQSAGSLIALTLL